MGKLSHPQRLMLSCQLNKKRLRTPLWRPQEMPRTIGKSQSITPQEKLKADEPNKPQVSFDHVLHMSRKLFLFVTRNESGAQPFPATMHRSTRALWLRISGFQIWNYGGMN